jgi:medium-chain acyl-[acyl-carrier-protein] hydrolase
MSVVRPQAATGLRASRWIQTYGSYAFAPRRLFCFPPVGGAASLYRRWSQRFGNRIEICAVQLPGREDRMADTPFRDLRELVRAVADALAPYLGEKPFAFFGHSMGAIISYELAAELRRRKLPKPRRLFLSAAAAPPLTYIPDPPRHTMTDEQLVTELRRLGGTPEELLQHRELLDLVLPSLKADFSVFDTYRYQDTEPLDVPISVFGGIDDAVLPEEKLVPWQEHTSADFTLRIFPGNHFYLQTQEEALTREIERLFATR